MTLDRFEDRKRYRVTVEGVGNPNGNLVIDNDGSSIGRQVWIFKTVLTHTGVTVEQLPDPEPVWVDNAVARVAGISGTFYHIDGQWRVCGGMLDFSDRISRAWRDGTLTVLWNGDTPTTPSN